MVVSKKKFEKVMSPIADNSGEDEGWMGVDIDFWCMQAFCILLVKIFNRVRNFMALRFYSNNSTPKHTASSSWILVLCKKQESSPNS